MSKNCEDIRPLIAELVYGEVDSDVAEEVREHLGTCLSCRRHQMAFLSVRKDLQEWQPEAAHEPRGITFIAPGAHVATPLWNSRIFQGLAVAATFVFAAFLMAAVVNLQVGSGPDGWAISTSLWETPDGIEQAPDETLRTNGPATQDPGQPQLVNLDEVPGLFDRHLADRGYLPAAQMPVRDELTDAQWDRVTELAWEIYDAGTVEHDAQADQRVRDLIAASQSHQADSFFMALNDVANNITADRRDEISEIYGQLDLIYLDTDRRLNQTNTRIDNLVTGQVAPPIGQEGQEH